MATFSDNNQSVNCAPTLMELSPFNNYGTEIIIDPCMTCTNLVGGKAEGVLSS